MHILTLEGRITTRVVDPTGRSIKHNKQSKSSLDYKLWTVVLSKLKGDIHTPIIFESYESFFMKNNPPPPIAKIQKSCSDWEIS